MHGEHDTDKTPIVKESWPIGPNCYGCVW